MTTSNPNTPTTHRRYWLVIALMLLACLGVFTYPYLEAKLPMNQLPRNMKLKAFDPFRADFTCVHEDTKVPPIDPQAQEWFEQSLALTNQAWYDQDDYKGAVALLEKAAERNHWKAMINLASIYANGFGEGKLRVERDTERAVLITEHAMGLGIPAAFDFMGVLHMEGRGVNGDASRGYAFAQLAADMGSPSAMAFLGAKLDASYSNPDRGFWGNRSIGRQMLECGMAQGNGQAAFELGASLDVIDKDYPRALMALHNAVKFGSAEAANSLSVKFSTGKPIVDNRVDTTRADRYSALGDALDRNPDLRFPNLDKILPLPPAKLPQWDGNPESLIKAAQGVRPIPQPPVQPAGSAPPSSRAYIPAGHALALPAGIGSRMQPLPGLGGGGLARAPMSGYWQVRPLPATPNDNPRVMRLREEFANLPPMRFGEGEPMQLTMSGTNLIHEAAVHSLVQWTYQGHAAPVHVPQDWLAQAGTVRSIEAAHNIGCNGSAACTQTGIWQPHVLDQTHPLHSQFADTLFTPAWKWQAFVQAGEPMPSLKQLGLPMEDAQVDWRLMQVTELGMEA